MLVLCITIYLGCGNSQDRMLIFASSIGEGVLIADEKSVGAVREGELVVAQLTAE